MASSKYRPEFAAKVRQLGRLGYLVTDAAHALGVKHQTFAAWERRHPEFKEAAKLVRANSERALKMRLAVMLSKTEAQLLKALAHVRRRRAASMRKHGLKMPRRWAAE